MANKTFKSTRIQTKRDTAANWEANNPVLLDGEKIIVDTNSGEVREKIGDGTKTYTQLPFTDEVLRTLIADKVDKEDGKGLSTNDYTTAEKTKLAGIAEGANNYTHPSTHSASMIVQDITHRFVTDEDVTYWNETGEDVEDHINNTSNPHNVTKSQIGLGNVENKSSETIRGELTKDNVITALGYTPPTSDTVYTHPSYTAKTSGLYKITVDNMGHVSDTTAVTKSDITGLGIPAQDTVYTHPSTHEASIITQDSTHRFVTDEQITAWNAKASTAVATTSSNGLMSFTDKSKLDGIADGANKTVVDSSLSSTSTNPVQNKVINTALAGKSDTDHTHTADEVGADPKGSADTALSDAKSYTDEQFSLLLENPTSAIDSVYELRDAMNDNADAISALETIAASKASSTDLTSHTNNTTIHITSGERTNWNAAYTHSQTTHAPSNAQANQNAFSNVAVGSTTIEAETTTDTLTLAGSNVTLTADATNDKVTIGITKDNVVAALGYTPPTSDTVYTLPTATSSVLGGVKIGDNITNTSGVISLTKANVVAALGYTPPTSDTVYTLPTATSSVLGGVKIGSNITNSSGTISITKDNVVTALGYTPPTSDTNTHYTSKNIVNNSATATANTSSALTNGNVFLNHLEESSVVSSHKITGSGATTVTTDTSGNIVITSTNTTYSTATTSSNGLMSNTDKTNLEDLITRVASIEEKLMTAVFYA